MSASERETMLRVVTALNILITEPEQLKSRMKDVPYYSRDVGMLRKKALTMIEKMTDTIPKEQMWQWYREVKSVSYTVGVSGVTSRNNEKYGVWLPNNVINALLEGCKEQCLMCNLDKGQRRACALKKALDAVPNDVPDKMDGDCPYYAQF
jgi:hypothetical protein